VLALTPEHADALNNRSAALVQLERYEEARQSSSAALKLRPRHVDALYNRSNAQQALGLVEEAVLGYREALTLEPGRVDILNNLGLALRKLGNREDALACWERGLALDPCHVELLYNCGNVLADLKRHQDALAAFEQALALDPRRAEVLDASGLALATTGRHQEALTRYEAALAVAPDNPDTLNNCGSSLIELKQFEKALSTFERALTIDPSHFGALNNRGNALLKLRRLSEALESYERALAIDPNRAQGLSNRGIALAELGRFEAALASYDKAIASDPAFMEAHVNRGNAFCAQGLCDEALANYENALLLCPDNHEARWNRGLAQLSLGQFREGWNNYESRWAKEMAHLRRNFVQPLWRGDGPLVGRTILLHAEQGLGDTLQFVRYVPMVARLGAKVLLEVQPPLLRLLSDIDGASAVFAQGEKLPAFDLQCPLMSLPLAFRTELGSIPAEIPYIDLSADLASKWRERMGERRVPRIGIAWAGSAAHKNNSKRSIALERFAPLLKTRGVEFVSIQKELTRSEGVVLEDHASVLHVGGELDDFADTAAVIASLDLLISADTSVAHLAGAIGRPVWILIPLAPDFRWFLKREDSPWYPTARLFRQPQLGDWDSVLERVGRDLVAFAEAG
jgi:tetratricopeptide (TPR) repeat protein